MLMEASNFESLGTAEMEELLGDIYIIIRIVANPCFEGWAGLRERQVLVFLLKAWLYPVLREHRPDMHVSALRVNTAMDLDNTLKALADRKCGFTFDSYIEVAGKVATQTEMEMEMEHACSR
eukprot:1536887-Karenia_brevis.AAC.2